MASNPKRHQALTFLLQLVFFFVVSTATSTSTASPPSKAPTVFDVLPEFGLPSGLLPDSVISYTLSEDGRFVVFLENPCYIEFDYLVYYDKTIRGKLNYGSITELEGIQVRRFFLWLGVDEIRVDLPPSDSIYFQVGFINKKLDLDQFKTVRSCYFAASGCGPRSWKQFLELPAPMEELEMLITE
ncbi:uncharacterized protein LOC133781672 [Humulus lupulus]|uniref:uncharacterized protein LOC133781672 n=1 Tax=Humulus lupulus TaxID=3486 RepID=UPI002B40BAD6|nr:uncharacterized protein LOC133781672 [Humulus lupulus]